MFDDLLVLGIETSCDETSAAIVRGGREVLSNVVSSQVAIHQRYGGVVPEVASRKHVEWIMPVVGRALSDAGVGLSDIGGIAVTRGPGLVGGLLVGIAAAKALAWSRSIPLVGVNHVEGHIYANFLAHADLMPPAICLTVSGGHTDLLFIGDYGRYDILGRTRDDAAGEAFDKVARVVGLGYPGGPAIDGVAKGGNPQAYDLPRSFPGSFDFSFSGLKTAVLNLVNSSRQKGEELSIPDLAASFQRAVVDVLIQRALMAAEVQGVRSIMLSGGVAANSELRVRLSAAAAGKGLEVFLPSLNLCTDNAAMIACAGHYRLVAGEKDGMDLNAVPALRLS